MLLELNLEKEKDTFSSHPRLFMDYAVAVYAGHNGWQMHCMTWDLFDQKLNLMFGCETRVIIMSALVHVWMIY